VDKDQELYIGTFDGGVFHSADRGESWRPISRALPNDSIRGIVVSDKTLIVATGRGIYKTDNKGQKWAPLNKGLTEQSIQSLVASHNGTLYAGTNAGVFRSSDEGATWVGVSEGLRVEQEVPFTFQ
jgi:ligand-binding sensor domain-containing protein